MKIVIILIVGMMLSGCGCKNTVVYKEMTEGLAVGHILCGIPITSIKERCTNKVCREFTESHNPFINHCCKKAIRDVIKSIEMEQNK